MIAASDILYLPCTSDLIRGGIAYALHSLPYQFTRTAGFTYERLRRVVAEAAVELAFRHYLTEQHIPFDVKRVLPFTEHDRYDVMLGGRRCTVQSSLIHQREQVSHLQRTPELILHVPALVASDQHAAEGQSPRDLYLFAFLAGSVTTARDDLENVIRAGEPYHLVHIMPETWKRPSQWNPLGKLVLKSESEESQTIEIGGQDQEHEMCSLILELPPQTRLEVENQFFSLAYVHTRTNLQARIGIHSPIRRETYLIDPRDWVNLWIYGMNIALVGYLSREEFSRRASFVPAGSRVFQYRHTQVKNLAVPVSELRSLSELLDPMKMTPPVTATDADRNG